MLEFYPDAGWDHDDLACRVFDRRSCDTGGQHATFTYKVDEDCYHDLGLCHSGDFYWANKVASMKCWKKSYGYPDGEIV
ncbi:hypothetical protein GRF29_19g229007 [Pseudopithomyces chartarum]|uniref:Uncharacterized protein n=1 Tax=Pseudopithomyces chartarum TaxID=1892770 RepID=A0AAN6M5G4_9PLEO|nr:hypothetical protein GRF29_19g229007 [Pseudopithomyces chartarum]